MTLPAAGCQNSTAEVEHELMDLWSSVEKTKAAREAQRDSMKRSKTRSDPAQGTLAQVGSHGHPAAPCGPGTS